jgi:GTP-binding protein HflX
MSKTVIVECKTPKSSTRMNEVRIMAESIGYDVKKCITQQRKTIHGSYCVGPGKLIEIKKYVIDEDIDVLIFTRNLKGSQIFKIQEKLEDVNVIDRNLLILEVFEKRAMGKEAKLQIELARLNYTFSWGRELIRLKGITHEQVGWSGPGDYPYSEYQKAARKRISKIKNDLKKTRLKKRSQRIRRRELGYPIVALAGYTQSGKTTFFNRLVSESKEVGLGPFTTLSPCSRLVRWQLNGVNFEFILVDSIGFIEDMHPMIIDAFEVTLDEISNADLLLLFVDVSEEYRIVSRKIYSMNKILRRLEIESKIVVCANKIDISNERTIKRIKKLIEKIFVNVSILKLSSLTGLNIDKVMEKAILVLDNEFKNRLSITV